MIFWNGGVSGPGRGVDQVLPHPGDPGLREGHADDAREYVRLAERTSGPVLRPDGTITLHVDGDPA